MKKQINPNVKAHLIRSAFYVLLLLAVCVIPFALAQRNSLKANRPTPAKPKAAAIAIARMLSPSLFVANIHTRLTSVKKDDATEAITSSVTYSCPAWRLTATV